MLLLTTPDYPPRLGGLSSHTLNVEKVLRELGVEYEVFNWKDYKDIWSFPVERLKKYDTVFNIHSGFHMHMPRFSGRVINFVNGAEILFYSPNPVKHLVKQLTKGKSLRKVESAKYNIFISDFTFRTLIKKGLRADYSRDLIFHMCVDTTGHKYLPKKWDEGPLRFICVARDVPHKNFAGAIKLCEKIQELSGREVEFITVTNKEFSSDKIKIKSFVNPDNKKRDELLASAHVNLLLSLDHSNTGFFEGFGQIVQEAGCFATPTIALSTGGLPESVHHQETGWVLKDLSDQSIHDWWNTMSEMSYHKISHNCYEHTLSAHGLGNWKKLFHTLLQK